MERDLGSSSALIGKSPKARSIRFICLI